MRYRIRLGRHTPALLADWDSLDWSACDTAEVASFRPESGPERPATLLRMGATEDCLYGIFKVARERVRCTRTGYGQEVWKDSCVEVFLQPAGSSGYFNLELNCGGAFLCNYITNWTRTPTGFAAAQRLPWAVASQIQVHSTLPSVIDPQSTVPTDWCLQFVLPLTVLKAYASETSISPGICWTGNFFKCAEDVGSPHWASWSQVDEFNFHLPRCFGDLEFVAASPVAGGSV